MNPLLRLVAARCGPTRGAANLGALLLVVAACGGQSTREVARGGGSGGGGGTGSGVPAEIGGTGGDGQVGNVGAAGSGGDAVSDGGAACDEQAPGTLTGSHTFAVDEEGLAHADYVLSAAPVGLAPCGDGFCLAGELERRVRFDPDLVAQGDRDVYVAKLRADGSRVFSRRLGGTTTADDVFAASFAANEQGDLALGVGCSGELVAETANGAATAINCAGDHERLLLLRLDAAGALLWAADLGTSTVVPPRLALAIDANGRTVVAAHVGGPITTPGALPEQVLVAAFARDGSELFRHYFVGVETYATDLAIDSQGNTVLTGFFAGTVTTTDGDATSSVSEPLDTAGSEICLLKLDSSGSLSFTSCFGGQGQANLEPKLALGPDDSIVLAGSFVGNLDLAAVGGNAAPSDSPFSTKGKTDIYLAKFDAGGSLVWQRQFGNEEDQEVSLGVAVTPEGNVLLPGVTWSALAIDGFETAQGTSSPFLAGFDAGGEAYFLGVLGKAAYVDGRDSITLGSCRSFYLAADYHGNLLAPGADQQQADGLAFVSGRY